MSLENAIRYTPEGGTILVDSWRQDACVCVSVADNGIGIPPESLPHIFDRFYRVEKRDRVTRWLWTWSSNRQSDSRRTWWRNYRQSHVGKGSKFMISLPLMSNKVALAG